MAGDALVRLTGLSKSFGPTRALDGAELALRRGTIHALLGGNGSGKSTAIKILAGVYPADAGTIRVGDGEWAVDHWSAATARKAGLHFVHQDLGLFDPLSVAENFALDSGYPITALRSVRWRQLERRTAELLERFEIAARPHTPVGALRPAQRTMVAIARALQDQESDSAVLVLDEPTAALPAHESELLLAAIRRRAERGQTILMVSHRMPEVLETADDFTVFRDGRTVGTLVSAAPTEHELVTLMTGREIALPREKTKEPGAREKDVTAPDRSAGGEAAAGDGAGAGGSAATAALWVDGLVAGPLTGISLGVQPGEIVGVTGLVGSGRSSLLRTVFGVHRPQGGSLWIGGHRQKGSEDVRARMARGVAYVAEDRVAESSFASLSVRENLSASVLGRFWRVWGMATGAERGSAARLIRQHKVKAPDVESPFSALSGGNQQKAILARWLRREPRLLLLDEPTQGVDVMSRADIYRTIRQSAQGGCGVLVASSDFVELCALCDRVVVLAEGRIATELRGARLTPDHLTAATQSSVLSTGVQA